MEKSEDKFFPSKSRKSLSMKQALNYGRISWSYEDFDPQVPCRPSPFVTFSPVRINGKFRAPEFSQRVSLNLLKFKTRKWLLYPVAFQRWSEEHHSDIELGEGRAFYRWLLKHQISIQWRKNDFEFHGYFRQKNSPRHSLDDEFAQGHSFAISPVVVQDRRVKLYVPDEAMLNLICLPYGEDVDFLDLVRGYVEMRFQWEKWRAPSPPFLEWIKIQGKRPMFSTGQLGIDLS